MPQRIYSKQKSRPVVPIVSMIDILTILLIYFIVAFTPKTKVDRLEIALPQASQLQTSSTPELRRAVSITADDEIFFDGEPVAAEELAARLAVFRAAQPDAKLELQADREASLGVLLSVWDALPLAGYSVDDLPARIRKAQAPAERGNAP